MLRSLEVVKSRGHEYALGRHSFRIVNGHGIEVYRRVQAPRGLQREAARRVRSDHAGLRPAFQASTQLVNGGYFVGARRVVAGISGVGKSVMGLQYIAEGARRGERSLMLTLDEHAGPGHPQREQHRHRSAGVHRSRPRALRYDPPQEMEIDRPLPRHRAIVEKFKPPPRVLIDSLSTYGVEPGHHRAKSFATSSTRSSR